MDRQIVYPGARPLETDVLNTNKYSMIGLSKLTAAVIGTGTLLNGLACTPGAGLTVSVAAGEIYSAQYVDANAYSTLAADVTHQIVKQGVMMDATTLSCPAPGSAGQSINYLVQVTFSEVDTNASVLTYYNSSNPSQPYSGPGNSGSAQNTLRQGKCVVAVKSGTAATTGSQTTPAVDAGYTAAYVVTVAYGASSITTGNIVKASGAPFITETLTQKISQTTADARYLQSVNFTFANLGSKPTTVSGFGITDAITTGNIGAQSVSFATTAGRAHPVRGDGSSWDLNWSGQAGQPSWLVGSNDGNNFYVYNPSNFSVNYSTSSGSAGYASTSTTQAAGTSNTSIATTQFCCPAYSKGSNGYTTLPDGHVFQYLRVYKGDLTGGTQLNFTFPTSFPNACASCVPVAVGNSSGKSLDMTATLNGFPTQSGGTLIFDEWTSFTQDVWVTLIAIGF